jgi:hypothetical protein
VYYLLDTEKGWEDNGSYGYFKAINKEKLYDYLEKKHLNMYYFGIEEIKDFVKFEEKRQEDMELSYDVIRGEVSLLEKLQKIIEVE